MQFRERFLRVYSEADWFAHLLLATCIVAALNFLEVFSETIAAAQAAGTHVVDGFEITVCYFGPPPAFYPRFFVLVALLVASLNVFKRTAFNRVIASLGSGVALAAYVLWWVDSYRSFCNMRTLQVKQFAYLYDGTPIDLGIVLSTAVCLVLLLDRLFDGEKTQAFH
ncbi:MAG TPA: hypothetical protein VJS13_11905 [Pyrinomonadaceae bacterium]|nr:hypothetical protein [Pyrinomonadaceae bacterium]